MTTILGTVCVKWGIPLFFELACENCYPIAEGVTNEFLTLLNNIAGLIVLSILLFTKHTGKDFKMLSNSICHSYFYTFFQLLV